MLGRQGLSNLCAVIKIGGKSLEDIIKKIKTEGLKRIVVTDMEALTGEQIDTHKGKLILSGRYPTATVRFSFLTFYSKGEF